MPYIYSYALKDRQNRNKTDLVHYKDAIELSINNIFQERVLNISVYRAYFEFTLSDCAIDTELRQMGKEIARNEPQLNEIKKDYGYSTQLLKRVNFDIVLKDKLNNTVAMVEVKSAYSDMDVKKVFRNMSAHSLIPNLEFFIIVTQNSGYLWRNTNICKITEPDLQISMKEIINRYVNEREFNDLRHSEMELILFQWLNQLSKNLIDENEYCDAERQLAKIGFIDAIHNSSVLSEVQV